MRPIDALQILIPAAAAGLVAISALARGEAPDANPDSPRPDPALCEAEPDPGPCEAHVPRYAYDAAAGRCERFVWGGCRGEPAFATLAACESACAAPGQARMRLEEGETALAPGGRVAITFAAVTHDSRCPRDVTCVHMGEAWIRLRLEDRVTGESDEARLRAPRDPGAQVGAPFGLSIRLQRLAPWPVSTDVGQDARRYEVALTVSRARQ